MEKTIALEDGRLLAKGYRHKAAGHEMLPTGAISDEFFVTLNGQRLSGATEPLFLLGTLFLLCWRQRKAGRAVA